MNERERVYAAYNWWTVSQVAEAIGAGEDFVRERIKGEVRGFQFKDVLRKGRDYLIRPSEVQRFIDENSLAAHVSDASGQEARLRRVGVYVIRAETVPTARYKIGVTSDIADRLVALATTCPVQVSLVAFIVGATPGDERALHKRFASSRLHGEWFLETPELLAFIAEHAI